MKNLLEVDNLKTYFFTDYGTVKAVQGISFFIKKGETLGLVGESGSGKTVTALSILRLISPPGKIIDGKINFKGIQLLDLEEKEMQKIRGKEISLIFQDPFTSLNPVFTVGEQISETIITHQKLNKKDARLKTIEMLKLVNIPQAEERIDNFPHQFSGGMQQRIVIAMALSCNPTILIADEPTTSLDVTIQSQILELLSQLKEEKFLSIIIITHNLGIIAKMCDRICIMYAGYILETADKLSIFKDAKHPYTQGLLSCIPKLKDQKGRLESIDGQIPDLTKLEEGCVFYPRCRKKMEICRVKQPEMKEVEKNHFVSCCLYN